MFWKHGFERKFNFSLSQIGSVDQTPLYFESSNTATVNKKGEKQYQCRQQDMKNYGLWYSYVLQWMERNYLLILYL